MSKKITINILDQDSIQNAINQINATKNKINNATKQYVDTLANAAYKVAETNINESTLKNHVHLRIEDLSTPDVACKRVVAEGEDMAMGFDSLLGIEYGAGIHYNKTPNPDADADGYGVGTFPGQTHAFEDGWAFKDEEGKWIYTHGVKATMPMYKARMEVLKQKDRVVKGVLKK